MDIKLKDFEGPLDLLLHLVSKYEVDIYDVPLLRLSSNTWLIWQPCKP